MDDSNTCAVVTRPRGHRFGMVDTAIIRDESLPRNVKTLYAYLATFCTEERSAFPARPRMARETGLSVRAVDEALKTGAACGLWTVERRPVERGRHLTNVYLLHDQGGTYVVGSGPGPRLKGAPRGRGVGADFAPRRAQILHGVGADFAPEVDKGTRPLPNKTSASGGDAFSGNAYAAGAHRASSAGDSTPARQDRKLHIVQPRNFDRLDDGAVAAALTGSCIAAMRKAGLTPDTRAGDALGYSIGRWRDEEGLSRRQLLARLRQHISLAGTDDTGWGWLATVPPRASAVAGDDDWAG